MSFTLLQTLISWFIVSVLIFVAVTTIFSMLTMPDYTRPSKDSDKRR